MILNGYLNSGCFSLCISNDYTVYSCGRSKFRAHGHEKETVCSFSQISSLHSIKAIACGYEHSIFLDFEGFVFSIGSNLKYQLGVGEQIKTYSIVPQKVDLSPCKQISCGSYFSICLCDDILFSFGYNNDGHLGLGNKSKYISPQQIPNLYDIDYVECGIFSIFCKTYDNKYYSWGFNSNGQLGNGTNINCDKPIQCNNWPDNIKDIKSGLYHALILTEIGKVYSFGDNLFGQLGINDKTIKKINTPTLIKDIPEIQRIECGYDHSICIDINNNLWVFGSNSRGQLGLGDKENRFKPILHPTLSNIIDISSGGLHTFIKKIDNKIYAFGNNEYSQFGTSKSLNQTIPIQILKDNEDVWGSFIGFKSRAKSARK